MRAGALILIFALTAAVTELFSVELEYPLLNLSTESDNMKTSHSSQVLNTITQSDRRPLLVVTFPNWCTDSYLSSLGN
ncbi:hypothetical protein MTP99_013453 [Tenebrio molitor]|nr:hypothetical protein MTP99_013453 [Tenebrio molitor]